MQIFIDAEGNATIVTPQHIYQGSNISEVNVVSLAFTPQTTLQIAFVLPDGTTTNYYPMSFNYSSTSTNYYQYIIQQAFTALSGQASIALLATDSQTQQQTSQLIPFTIEPSVLPTLPDTPSQDEWTTLLQYVQQNSSNIANLQATISDIENIANTANTNASQAVSTANEALSTAQQAEQTANALADSIAQANTNASQAVSTANEAKTTADGLAASIAQANETANEAKTTADGLAASIAQANETASQAVSTANQAVTSAQQANTTANQAVATANQANETAQEALEQVIAGEGTKVTVGGQTVKTLGFDSDPQTQINNNSESIQEINSGKLPPRCDTYQNSSILISSGSSVYVKIGSLKSFLGGTDYGIIDAEITGLVTTSAPSTTSFVSFSISAALSPLTTGVNTIIITQKENTSPFLKQVIFDNEDIIFYLEGFTDSAIIVGFSLNFVYANGNITPSISKLSDYTPSESAIIFTSNTTGLQTESAKISNLVAEMLNGAAPVNINDFLSNIGESGYQKLPSGLIIQWGKVGAYSQNGNTTQTFSVTLPIAFPTRWLSAAAQLGSVDISGTSTNYEYYAGVRANLTTLTIAVRWQSQYTNSIYWIAIGY